MTEATEARLEQIMRLAREHDSHTNGMIGHLVERILAEERAALRRPSPEAAGFHALIAKWREQIGESERKQGQRPYDRDSNNMEIAVRVTLSHCIGDLADILAASDKVNDLNIPVWKCKTCGCLWRDNLDETVSLFNAEQKSCGTCEMQPTKQACEVHWLQLCRSSPEAAPDTGMQAVALLEWARQIRAAEDQDALLQIADDMELNANAALAAPDVPPTQETP